jgi:peptide/nickel transport system substrate-binding protein
MRRLRTLRPGVLKSMPGRSVWMLAALASLALVPAADAQQNRPRRTGGTVVIAGASDLQHLNSLVNTDAWTREFIDNALFLRLVTLNRDLSYAPQLAASWRMIGDTAVVFRIRRDVRWHDGRRTTAHDVAFTFDRLKDEQTASPHVELFNNWNRAQVVDSFTIRFSIKPHVEPIFAWTQLAVMPQHLLDTIPAARLRQASFNRNPVGNGPFRFVSGRSNERWVFEANRAFPAALGGRPLLDRLIWRVVPDNTAQITEIRTGQVDMILGPRAENVALLDAEPSMRALVRPSNRYNMITWNNKRETLSDARVRRALTLSMNRAEMLQVLRKGYGSIAVSPIPPYHWAYDHSLQPLPFDTVTAKRLLTQAGWVDRNGDGVRENAAGKPLEIELKVTANNQFNRDIGEMIRAQLERVGVKINVRPVDFATMIGDITNPERNYDAAYLQMSTDLVLNFHDAFHSSTMDNQFHASAYTNPEIDRILDRAMVTSDRKAATALWARFQRIMRDDQPITMTWWSPDLIVVRERLQGVQMDVRGALISLPRWYVVRN